MDIYFNSCTKVADETHQQGLQLFMCLGIWPF